MMNIKSPSIVKKYVPPNKRQSATSTSITKDTKLDFSEDFFPSLQTPTPTSTPIYSPRPPLEFKQTIMNLIAKDELDEAERNREPEYDPLKMTDKELELYGYAVLELSNLPATIVRFNTSLESGIWIPSCASSIVEEYPHTTTPKTASIEYDEDMY
jgi:hypothetical protein